MGARVSGQGDAATLPLVVTGQRLRALRYELPVASAQVQSCLLLAGLRAAGTTAVREPGPCRDHTERLLAWFGWPVARRPGGWVEVPGDAPAGRAPGPLVVAGDPSSAAFWLALAAPQPGAEVTVRGVSLNPTRTGFLDVLRRMGAAVAVTLAGAEAGEPVGDVTVRGGALRAIREGGADLGRVIDEVPLVALLATRAEGTSRLAGLAELRVKESDRVRTIAAALGALGARVSVDGDALDVEGGARLGGGTVEADGDHRIAMMAAVAAAWGGDDVRIRDVGCVATSYPGFFDQLVALTGAAVTFEDERPHS
jgi:3-phosphoshikimate 1-carboxyvinyltransferase